MLPWWVAPFGYLRINCYLHIPAACRSLSRPSSPQRAKASSVRPYLLSLALWYQHHCWYRISPLRISFKTLFFPACQWTLSLRIGRFLRNRTSFFFRQLNHLTDTLLSCLQANLFSYKCCVMSDKWRNIQRSTLQNLSFLTISIFNERVVIFYSLFIRLFAPFLLVALSPFLPVAYSPHHK